MNLNKLNKELEANTTLSHYRIVSKIGARGMGEVYLAQDTGLDRKVAIKFLNEEFSKDADKLTRFIREAKAASALNHPNILTVYEIGEVDGKNYIATELIDGKTLREHLSRKESLQLNAILKIGVQVSEALSAAHQAGIIHRDIKPENIMLRRDGYAKVLDFGLAKLSEPGAVATGSAGSEDATRVQVNTTPGMVMGTVSYMSPEQARGKETDARTDIWSLGVVLYEMLSGKVPFSGETINHTIVSILEKEPLLLENVPAELQRIVRKSMTKDVDMRYQTAHDLLIDLKNLRRDLDIQGELERSIIPNRVSTTESANENQTQVYATDSVAATSSSQAAAPHSVTTSSSSLEYAVTQAKSHKLVSAIVGIVLLAIVTTIAYFAFVSKGGTRQINSIAVMPFVNESGDKEVEYLSDGMTETLISSLTQIPNLSVKASSSVFYYKGKNTSPKQIGEELGVEAILLGKIVKRHGELVLRLELVNTKTLDAIWSETYNRKLTDLVSLQREIAGDVSTKLRLKLTTAEQAKVTKSYTTDSEAQQYYLKGRFHWNKRKSEDFLKALEYFNKAIEEDPNYALAYAGLADTYSLIPQYGDFRPKDYYPRAKQAAQKALELDDSLAEAHTSMGNITWSYEYDQKATESAFRKAIEINPRYATARQWNAEYLSSVGKSDEALREIYIALELDPFSRVINRNVGYVLYEAKRYDDAIVQLKKAIELFPDDPSGHRYLRDIYAAKGDFDSSVASYLTALKIDGQKPEKIKELGDAYRRTGWKGFWLAQLNDQLAQKNSALENDKSAYVQKWRISQMYAAIGDKDNVIEYLRMGIDEHEPDSIYYLQSHYYDFMRDDPRFKELIKKVGFPE